jgi:hypothetical protein
VRAAEVQGDGDVVSQVCCVGEIAYGDGKASRDTESRLTRRDMRSKNDEASDDYGEERASHPILLI